MNVKELIEELQKAIKEGEVSETDVVTLDTYDSFTYEIKNIESRGDEAVLMAKYPPLEED